MTSVSKCTMKEELLTVQKPLRSRACGNCTIDEVSSSVSFRPCNTCRDMYYCSDWCREADIDSHSCLKTISDRNSYTRNCYILRSQQQHAKDTIQEITKLTDDRRDQLLSAALQRAANAERTAKTVLKQVSDWNPIIAEKFEIKALPFSSSPLRMLHSTWETVQKSNQPLRSSFVALSYSWRTKEWNAVAAAYHPPGAEEPLPICKCLWDFLLGQLELHEEGIWIDQLCLDQEDSLEKMSAVASMDALYASARLVFIALEDISLMEHEVSILSNAIKQVAEDHDLNFHAADARKIFAVVAKIFHARWFSRAWCFHEYHLSKNRILAIPCTSTIDGPVDSAIGLANFGDLIFRLAYFQNETIQRENEGFIHKLLSFFGGQDYAYSNIISNTFSYHSRHYEDKLAISLNICQLGLSLTGVALASNEGRLYLLIIALAAGDATILTTRGLKVHYGKESEGKTSWLHWPNETSWSTRHDFPLPWGIHSLSLEHIDLDLLLLTQAVFRKPCARSIKKAEAFLSSDLAGQIRMAYGLQEKGARYVEEYGVIETLASAIDSGLLWMIGAWHRIQEEVIAEVEQSYDLVVEMGHSCLKSLFPGRRRRTRRATTTAKPNLAFPWHKRCNMERWPRSYRDKKMKLHAKARFAKNSLWRSAYEMVLCILLFGKYWEMGMVATLPGDTAITDLHSRGVDFYVPAPSEHKMYSQGTYTFFPKASTFLAVPRVLADAKFILSDRLWLLEKAGDGSSSGCWRVLEKVGLVGCGRVREDGKTVSLLRNQRVIG